MTARKKLSETRLQASKAHSRVIPLPTIHDLASMNINQTFTIAREKSVIVYQAEQ